MRRHQITAALCCATLAAGLTACSGGDGGDGAADTAAATPHGYVEGAEEADEPQLRLAAFDTDAGKLTLLDLLTGDTVDELDTGTPAGADKRYIFARDDHGTTVIDSGVWTVDHGDHFHYYRSDPGETGTVDAATPGHVISADSRLAFFDDASGDVKVYPRADLEDDKLDPATEFTVGAHHGVAVPFADLVLSTTAPDKTGALPTTLAAYGEDGKKTDLAGDVNCPDIHGATTTRDAALFACADGVLAVTADGDTPHSTKLPYPAGAQGRAYSLAAGRDLVAAPLEDGGLVLFDPETGDRHLAATDAPVASVAVAADDKTVLAVDDDGTGYAVDPATGDILASAKITGAGDGDGPAPTVALGTERGYVSDPAAGTVTELDVADGLRETRTFDLGGAPSTLALVGGR
jgi:hypothetical protein